MNVKYLQLSSNGKIFVDFLSVILYNEGILEVAA